MESSLSSLSRFNDLTINSACRGPGSYSIQLLSPSEFQRTYRFRIRTSLTSSRLAPRIARAFYRVMPAHHVFNFTKHVIVTHSYKNRPRAPRWMRPVSHGVATLDCSHQTRTRLLSAFASTLVPMQLSRHACRTCLVATARRCLVADLLQAEVRHTTLATLHCIQMCLFHVNAFHLQWSLVSRYSLGHCFRNQKLERRRSSRPPPLCCCVSSLPSPPTCKEFLELIRLLCLCRPISSRSLCKKHTHQLGHYNTPASPGIQLPVPRVLP